MRVARVFTPLSLLAFGLCIPLVFSACSTIDFDRNQGVSHDDRVRAENLHGNKQEVSRALHLFDRLLSESEGSNTHTRAHERSVHVSQMHRVSLTTAVYGRRDFKSGDDAEEGSYKVDETRYLGWIAEMSSKRTGLVEMIFYDRNWVKLAVLTRAGVLTIGNGNRARVVPTRLELNKAAEYVYQPPTRYGLKAFDEDITELERVSDAAGLTKEYEIENLKLGSRIVRDVERLNLETRPVSEFRDFDLGDPSRK